METRRNESLVLVTRNRVKSEPSYVKVNLPKNIFPRVLHLTSRESPHMANPEHLEILKQGGNGVERVEGETS